MITSLNINDKPETIVVSERIRDKIEDMLSTYVVSRYRIDVRLSQSTFKECRDELDNIFGVELLNMVFIMPDNRIRFGVITIDITDMKEHVRVKETDELQLFEKVSDYDLSNLKNTINIESPQFLIMSMGTWQTLNLVDDDNIDIYNHEVAYYHSYYKVPVAITEFAKPGEVYIVK